MPYSIIKSDKPRGYFVITTATGKKHSKKPFATKKEATAQLIALYINTKDI
jgi:hypothetical protein